MHIREKKIVLSSIIIVFVVAAIGSFFTFPEIPGWYESLEKPFFQPPGWIFAPAWTILYFLMAVSAYLVWRNGLEKPQIKEAMLFFFAQLFLNLLWPILFFGMKNLFLALIELLVLWILIIMTMLKFKPIEKRAFYLLLPYIIWVSFASILNFSVWILNT